MLVISIILFPDVSDWYSTLHTFLSTQRLPSAPVTCHIRESTNPNRLYSLQAMMNWTQNDLTIVMKSSWMSFIHQNQILLGRIEWDDLATDHAKLRLYSEYRYTHCEKINYTGNFFVRIFGFVFAAILHNKMLMKNNSLESVPTHQTRIPKMVGS